MADFPFEFEGVVERFPGVGGWIYSRVPLETVPVVRPKGAWGFTKILAKLGSTEWETSLLPMGDGTWFIALKSSVRKREKIEVGTQIRLAFRVK